MRTGNSWVTRVGRYGDCYLHFVTVAPPWGKLSNGVRAGAAPLALLAKVTEVKSIDPFHDRVEMSGFVGHKAGFKIPPKRAFCTEPGSGEVRGTDEGFLSIDHDSFGVNTRAENSLEEIGFDKGGVFVKVGAESGPGFLGVKEADGDTALDGV